MLKIADNGMQRFVNLALKDRDVIELDDPKSNIFKGDDYRGTLSF